MDFEGCSGGKGILAQPKLHGPLITINVFVFISSNKFFFYKF